MHLINWRRGLYCSRSKERINIYIFLSIYFSMANTIREKELMTKWPVTDGKIAGTTTQQGHVMQLIPEKSLINKEAGIDY